MYISLQYFVTHKRFAWFYILGIIRDDISLFHSTCLLIPVLILIFFPISKYLYFFGTGNSIENDIIPLLSRNRLGRCNQRLFLHKRNTFKQHGLTQEARARDMTSQPLTDLNPFPSFLPSFLPSFVLPLFLPSYS